MSTRPTPTRSSGVSRLFGMALLTTLLTPGLHISELAVRRPLLRSRSHAVCKLDVATANAFSCMGFNIGRQVPCQASWRAALQPTVCHSSP